MWCLSGMTLFTLPMTSTLTFSCNNIQNSNYCLIKFELRQGKPSDTSLCVYPAHREALYYSCRCLVALITWRTSVWRTCLRTTLSMAVSWDWLTSQLRACTLWVESARKVGAHVHFSSLYLASQHIFAAVDWVTQSQAASVAFVCASHRLCCMVSG